MTIKAKVIAHSRAPGLPDLITLECRYPRMIHSEFMTHRVFSRNASSSRAIPIDRMIQDVIDDPAMPVSWGSNKPGMQAGEECANPITLWTDDSFEGRWDVAAEEAWLVARNEAVEAARAFSNAGYHKQIVNRLLEPFGHISVVVTASEWQNFFDLRCHPDADPTMCALAEAMRDAIEGSTPNTWDDAYHLPYVGQSDWDWAYDENRVNGTECFAPLAMISAARCARVSYLNHDGTNPDIEKDLKLAKTLLESKHMSPFEHQAQAVDHNNSAIGIWPPVSTPAPSNLVGWIQHRKTLEVV